MTSAKGYAHKKETCFIAQDSRANLELNCNQSKEVDSYMNENTQKLTFGALLVAVFGVLLLLNRQTGGMLEETFLFLFPIPMVAFSARYGWKDSLPVFVCTVLISIFCGIFTSAFYAATQSFIGVVYGSCLHAKRDSNKTMLLVMALSTISNLLSTIVLAALFGFDLQEDIEMMQTMMHQAIEKAGTNMTPEQMQALDRVLQPDTLLRMLIVSVIFMGVVQGFIVCQLSLLILRRLRFQIQKPAPIISYYPPRWTGFIALVLYWFYGSTLALVLSLLCCWYVPSVPPPKQWVSLLRLRLSLYCSRLLCCLAFSIFPRDFMNGSGEKSTNASQGSGDSALSLARERRVRA